MGFDLNGLRALLKASQQGVAFDRTMTIGRQRLHLDPKTMQEVLGEFNITLPDEQLRQIYSGADRYCEPFMQMLGAQETASLDTSAFEGATKIHDMNLPIDAALRNAYSAVIDSGALEHIFNFPQAIRNCMEMITVGGHFIGIVPANNFMGHGFYQFSPELYFRVFSTEYGFKVEKLMLYESIKNGIWKDCPDPKAIGKRVELVNSRPTFMFVVARKTADIPLFSAWPQQSDYVAQWSKNPTG
jgi:hypothetical protein